MFNPKAYKIVTEVNGDWTAGTSTAVPIVSVENTMAFELGEFFYQLNAALDSLIYQTAILAEGIDPPSNEIHLYFPICAKRKTFKSAPVSQSPFPQELINWLASVQPYVIDEMPDTPNRTLIETLMQINSCAKRDRHRRFHVVAAIPANIQCTAITDPDTVSITNARGFRVNVLEEKAPFLTFEIRGADPHKPVKLNIETELTFDVSIDQIPMPYGRPNIELDRMLEAVRYVLRVFEDGFRAGHESLSGGQTGE